MRVAIFQKSQKHTEVFGFIMEFCKANSIKLDLHVVKYGFWYGPYFNSMLNTHFDTFDARKITPQTMKKYNFVFATTAKQVESIRGFPTKNIFFIHHIPGNLRQIGKNISLTPLIKNCNYLFPVYNGSSVIKQKDNIFGIVGHLGARNIRDLGRTINHHKYRNRDFKIYVFTRSNFQPSNKKILVFRFCKTEEMIERLKECKFLLSIPKPDSYYFKDRLSGELPLAYSHNLPICMPKRMNQIYNLIGTVCYNRSLIEVFGILLNMKGERYKNLVTKLQKHRQQIIKGNHKRLKKLMRIN